MAKLEAEERTIENSLKQIDRDRAKAVKSLLADHGIQLSAPAATATPAAIGQKPRNRRSKERINADRKQAVEFVKKAKEPVSAGEIKQVVDGINAADLRALVENGLLTMQGEKAAARYSPAK